MNPAPLSALDFQNTQFAFEYKSDADLQKSYLLFSTMQSNWLVKMGPKLVNLAFRLHFPIDFLLKSFLFNQFCGGTTLEETILRSKQLYKYKVRTVLDYSVEGEKNEQGFQDCAKEIIKMIDFAQKYEEIAFVALKITGIGSFQLLEKKQLNKPFSQLEEKQWNALQDRLNTICAKAAASNQPVFIDAEESWIQDAIDDLAEEMMRLYNKEKPLIYTTAQMYRHDRLQYVQSLVAQSKTEGYIPAIKIVRGAYLEKENERAQKLRYPTPMQSSKKNTDDDYNAAIRFCLENIDSVAICAGTHNEESCRYVTALLHEKGIPENHPFVSLSQLFGMSDHLSFNLAKHGYNVSKYLPYGPLRSVLPYLFRRAEENTSIAGQTGRELRLIEKEIARRKGKKQ